MGTHGTIHDFVFHMEMATHCSTLAWKIPWTEEPGRLVHGVAKSQTWLSDFTFTFMPLWGLWGNPRELTA